MLKEKYDNWLKNYNEKIRIKQLRCEHNIGSISKVYSKLANNYKYTCDDCDLTEYHLT